MADDLKGTYDTGFSLSFMGSREASFKDNDQSRMISAEQLKTDVRNKQVVAGHGSVPLNMEEMGSIVHVGSAPVN